MDPRAGAAAPSRGRSERSAPVPGSRASDPLLRSYAQAVRRHAEAQHLGGRRALALRNLRRSPDHPGPNRRARRPGHRPPAPPRARILAHEGTGGGPRHPQREGALLRGGSADFTRDTGPDEPVGSGAGAAGSTGQCLHPEKGSPLGAGARCPPGGGPRRPPESSRHIGRATRARAPRPVESGPFSTPPGQSGAAHRRPASAPRARVLERPGRLRRRRSRVRDGPGGGAMDSRALDQCRRQSSAWLPGVGVRRRVHLVSQ